MRAGCLIVFVIEQRVRHDGCFRTHRPLLTPRDKASYHRNAVHWGGGTRRGDEPHDWEHGVISSEYLLHKAAAGDSAALQECVARYGGLVWSLARRLQMPEGQAEDVVQEIFTDLWKSGHRYDPAIASETAFVAMIARRRLIDQRRKLSRMPAMQAIGEHAPVQRPGLPPADVGEEAARASEALRSLSAEQQKVLRLAVYEGLSHELISQSTGLPLGTVKTHARRGLMRLRELLIGRPEGDPSPLTVGAGRQGGVKP